MNNKEYSNLVLNVWDTPSGYKLLEYLTKTFHDKLFDFEVDCNSPDVGIKRKSIKSLYIEIGKNNLIQAFQYIVDNKNKLPGIDIEKFNEGIENDR